METISLIDIVTKLQEHGLIVIVMTRPLTVTLIPPSRWPEAGDRWPVLHRTGLEIKVESGPTTWGVILNERQREVSKRRDCLAIASYNSTFLSLMQQLIEPHEIYSRKSLMTQSFRKLPSRWRNSL